ncbi:unnamed protein product [Brachionus calyciflorus]|uniref:Uncharacterized protein n=1 Tax=Brachionus calyciflorus TaxID=104777 RepID=A0A814TAE0_9BILA|nr:unnamed protein product [Brachionus calyciflorus]
MFYICLDKNLKPNKSKCNLISLGINYAYTFDQEMRNSYDCNLYSFDPFIESGYFKAIRNKNSNLKESPVLQVDEKWFFYRLGISSNRSK